MVFLAGLAGALPLDSGVRIDNSWYEAISLFLAVMGESGEVKSPLLRNVLEKCYDQVEWLLESKYNKAHEEWLTEEAEYQRALRSSSDAELPIQPKEPQRPACLLKGHEINSEGVNRHLMNQDMYPWARRSVAAVMHESVAFFKNLTSTTGESLRSTLMTAYDGDGSQAARANSENERHYKKARFSLVVLGQDHWMKQVLDTKEEDRTGILSRIQMLRQDKRVKRRRPRPGYDKASTDAQQFLRDRYTFIAKQGADAIEGSGYKWDFTLSPEADDALSQLIEDIDAEVQISSSPMVKESLNKKASHAIRLAALLEMAWAMDAEGSPISDSQGGRVWHIPTVVSLETFNRAVKLATANTAWMTEVRLQCSEDSKAASWLRSIKAGMAKYQLRKDEDQWWTVKELREMAKGSRRPDTNVCQCALELLASHGLLQRQQFARHNRPDQPTIKFRLP